MTAQPLLFYNLGVVPVGLGLGRVFELPGGASLNTFVEPQYSVIQSGPGVPSFQVFAGVVVQLPVRFR